MKPTENKSRTSFILLIFTIVLALCTLGTYLLAPSDIQYAQWIGLASAAFFFAYLVTRYRERKAAGTVRGMQYSINATITVVIALTGVVFVNYLASQNDHSVDFTKTKRHSLSPQIKKIVQGLEEPVTIKAFLSPQDMTLDNTLRDFMRNLASISKGNIIFDPVDVQRDPLQLRRFEIKKPNTLVLLKGEEGGKSEKISGLDSTNMEQKLIEGLMSLTSTGSKKVYFLTGHGEKTTMDNQREGLSMLKENMTRAGYELADLSLVEKNEVPADATMLLVVGPRSAPFAPEIEAIKKYPTAHGNAAFLFDPDTPLKWNDVLADRNISFSNRIVLEPNALAQLAQLSLAHPLINNYNTSTEVGKELGGRTPSVYYIASDLKLKNDAKAGIEVKWLAKTGERSWAESDLKIGSKAQKVEFNDGKDIRGPLIIAATSVKKSTAATKPDPKKPQATPAKKESRVIVFGDSDFVSNQLLRTAGNMDVALNAMGWLSKDPNQITIRPKPKDESKLEVTQLTSSLRRWGTIGFYPVLLLIFAFVMYRRRMAL